MKFKDYYATLGLAPSATQAEVKRAYRKLARKYHPDVSHEPEAVARFQEVAEAHEALIDTERRAAYDEVARRHAGGQEFSPPPGWDSGFEFSGAGAGPRAEGPGDQGHDFSDFFGSLFGRSGFDGPGAGRGGAGGPDTAAGFAPGRRHDRAHRGRDHHAKLAVTLLDALAGAQQRVTLQLPVAGAGGHTTLQARQLDVRLPAGVRPGQRLRLAGQGGAGSGGAANGDLYLEVQLLPHPLFRLDGGDISFDLPLAPWEAVLGATVQAPTPGGSVQLTVPPGSQPGRRLRLKGLGLPGQPAGDLYAVLGVALPPALLAPEQAAYTAFAQAFADFKPRAALLS